jgi:hypothetical protein
MNIDKELNFRVYLFFHIRKIDNKFKEASVFSVLTLNEFIGLPKGTLNHFLKLRRLLNNDKLYEVESFLKKYFGFNPNRKLTKEELELREEYEIFN